MVLFEINNSLFIYLQ